jgi:hypothetical protein
MILLSYQIAGRLALAAVACLWFAAAPATARTLVLTLDDCEMTAVISSEAPRLSWAAFSYGEGTFSTVYIDLYSTRTFLVRYPLDKIPRGQRITNAEWVLPVNLLSPATEQRLYIRRILPEWGAGVCYQYRMVRPKKLEWVTPGARGASTDRVAKPSAVVRLTAAGDHVANVTEDVELWYTKAAPNNGWMVSLEDDNILVRFAGPVWGGRGQWKLRITYEPE